MVARWMTTCKRYVAFLDIMGFEDMVMRNSHKTVLGKMNLFRKTAINDLEVDAHLRLHSEMKRNQDSWKLFGNSIIRPVLFSDSILLISNNGSFEAAEHIIFDVIWLLKLGIELQIPIKGAISFGQQTSNFKDSIHFGKPLIDAFRLQEELRFYGAIIHHTAENELLRNNKISSLIDYNLIRYDTPLRDRQVKHYVVNWLAYEDKFNAEKIFSKLYCSVSGITRSYVDCTLSFANFVIDKKNKKG